MKETRRMLKNNYMPRFFGLAYWFILASSIVILVGFIIDLFARGAFFWDMDVYVGAVDEYLSGNNPYDKEYATRRFVYAPIVLDAFSLGGDYVREMLILFYLITFVFFILTPHYKFAIATLASFGIFGISEQSVGMAVATGNLTIFLHLLTIAIWLRPGGARKQALFLFVVIVASLIKPYFAAYFLLPFLSAETSRTAIVSSFVAGAMLALAWMLQYLFRPELFGYFLDSLISQTRFGEGSAYQGDLGYSLYRYFAFFSNDAKIALVLHAFTLLGLIVIWKKYLIFSRYF